MWVIIVVTRLYQLSSSLSLHIFSIALLNRIGRQLFDFEIAFYSFHRPRFGLYPVYTTNRCRAGLVHAH